MTVGRASVAYDPSALFAPEILLDVQLMPVPMLPCRGEYALCAAILERALEDAKPNAREDLNHRRSAKREARAWLADDDRTWHFSFLNICDVLGIEPISYRRALTKKGYL